MTRYIFLRFFIFTDQLFCFECTLPQTINKMSCEVLKAENRHVKKNLKIKKKIIKYINKRRVEFKSIN